MKFAHTLVAAICALGAAVPLGHAAGPTRGTEAVVYTITQADIIGMIDRLELEHEPSEVFEDYEWVRSGDFVLHVGPEVCDVEGHAPGCYALSMLAYWTIDQEQILEALAAVNDFNSTYFLTRAYLTELAYENGEAVAMLGRYAITDAGVTIAHLEDNLSEFLSILDEFDAALSEFGAE
jgi:hypothetical protein